MWCNAFTGIAQATSGMPYGRTVRPQPTRSRHWYDRVHIPRCCYKLARSSHCAQARHGVDRARVQLSSLPHCLVTGTADLSTKSGHDPLPSAPHGFSSRPCRSHVQRIRPFRVQCLQRQVTLVFHHSSLLKVGHLQVRNQSSLLSVIHTT